MPGLFGIARGAAIVLALVSTTAAQAADPTACSSYRPEPVVPADPQLCAELASVVRNPSALPLDQYEIALNRFASAFCHRDEAAGWVHDKHVRLTGPRIATLKDGKWTARNFATHSPVVIWYSPEMADWLRTWRPAEGAQAAGAPPPPDGAIIVKEQYEQPVAPCRAIDPVHLLPGYGGSIMVRDGDASHDGWFWGYFITRGEFVPDWPPRADNPPTNAGFGHYCLNCHGSAQFGVFSASENMAGEPGEPLSFLSQDIPGGDAAAPMHDGSTPRANALEPPRATPDADVFAALRAYALAMPERADVVALPSQTFDHTFIKAGAVQPSQTFVTANICAACHDAGTSGVLQYDMTVPDPHGGTLLNLSQYATWRSSPMGLAGRDPFFYAQLASEIETFHPDDAETVQATCFGCHGVAGARQFQIDAHAATGACPPFTRDRVEAVPWPGDTTDAALAHYGGLARDGVTCVACHRMAPRAADAAALAGAPQNGCVAERQASLNPGLTGFARTFTGSQLMAAPDTVIGPFADPKAVPMKEAIGITPKHDPAITGSEVCGSCHTVHLPILKAGRLLGRVYEQATYPEWAFSAYRTGSTADGVLPLGAGDRSQTCQHCHMASRDAAGNPRSGKIASIQEFTNFPESTHNLGPEAIDLPVREGVSQHTLVGLNLFLIKMAKQFPDLLGIHTGDPVSGDIAIPPLALTERAMLDQARNATATIAVSDVGQVGADLSATVKITSHAGHKFPSGVGFRRAFIAFEVLGRDGDVLWASGRTDAAGVIVGGGGAPVDGEIWWKDDCSGYLHPGERRHQPHYQTVTAEDEVQIYQELSSAPPAEDPNPVCGFGAAPGGDLTTSFLSICATVKDNRILPAGTLPLAGRIAVARALGADEDLAYEAGPSKVGDDPDYVAGGSDTVRYVVPLATLPPGAEPASVRATLYYQAAPPFYLQDRFCTSRSRDTERLLHMVGHLDLDGSAAEGWKLQVATTGAVPLPE